MEAEQKAEEQTQANEEAADEKKEQQAIAQQEAEDAKLTKAEETAPVEETKKDATPAPTPAKETVAAPKK